MKPAHISAAEDAVCEWIDTRTGGIVTYPNGIGGIARAGMFKWLAGCVISVAIVERAMQQRAVMQASDVGCRALIASSMERFDELVAWPRQCCVLVTPQAFTLWAWRIAESIAPIQPVPPLVHMAPAAFRSMGSQHTKAVLKQAPKRRFFIVGRVVSNMPDQIYPTIRLFGVAPTHTRSSWTEAMAVVKHIGHHVVPIGWKPGAIEKAKELLNPHTLSVPMPVDPLLAIDSEKEPES